VLIGRDAHALERGLAGCAPVLRAEGMRQAVHLAGRHAQEGQIVLLSPACASFDMYESYEARGDDFAAAVREWATRENSGNADVDVRAPRAGSSPRSGGQGHCVSYGGTP